MTHSFSVDLLQCEETGVLVATSDDIPGLVLEAETLGGIMDALVECAPELIRQNLKISPDEGFQFTFKPRQTPVHPVPRSLFLETAPAQAA